MKRFIADIKRISFGQWSLATFLIAVLSGVILTVPFDVANPYQSIASMMIAKPAASFVRNLHFWSAQLFLVFLFLHLYEYFKKKEPVRLSGSVWLRLTLGLVIIFLLMFTGFLLRADADALQAREIFNRLVKEVPLVGDLLAFILLGKEGGWQLIYLNHAAVFTVITVYIIFEHSRKVWPDLMGFVLSVLVTGILAFFFTAPLHDNQNPTVKGPWYFVGLQDLLHWFSHPAWVLVLLAFLLLLVYWAGSQKPPVYFWSRRVLLLLSGVYLLLTVDGMFFRGAHWQQVFPWEEDYGYRVWGGHTLSKVDFSSEKYGVRLNDTPLINGRPESCMICHDHTTGFSASHNPEALGCFSCHGGNPLSADKETAHQNMILIPGNLSDAEKSCGNTGCHPEITERIHSSLMTNLTGMVNVDRYVFGEQATPDGQATLFDLHHSPADEHLRNLCVRCHIGNEKTEIGPVTEESRGGGCLACHLNYDEKALNALKKHQENSGDTTYLIHHVSVDLNVGNDHCFGCHSRSGRISTNYEGWHETLFSPEEVAGKKRYRIVENSRVFEPMPADVHHTLGLECVDCHTSYELMGDGTLYQHQEAQQDVQCSDCHTDDPQVVEAGDLDAESAVIAGLRLGSITGKRFVQTAKHHKPLINVEVKHDSLFLTGKNSGKKFWIKPPAEKCQRDHAHQKVSCSACHSAWAPTCIGCHNAYDPKEPGYNMVLNKEKQGSWVEYVGTYLALPPTLGVKTDTNRNEEVVPVIPGMILTIDLSSWDKKLHDSLLFRRLYAPAAPHTTMAKGRSCRSCHNDPLALGYGKGMLKYVIEGEQGRWHFVPEYKNNPHDGLPEDAWIPFLGYRGKNVSTRTNVFPLGLNQQKRMLTVGACLTCHDDNSPVMNGALQNFDSVLLQKSSRCILPVW